MSNKKNNNVGLFGYKKLRDFRSSIHLQEFIFSQYIMHIEMRALTLSTVLLS